jgi:hypothetical protein
MGRSDRIATRVPELDTKKPWHTLCFSVAMAEQTTEYDNHHDPKDPEPARDPRVRGLSPARSALLPEGSGLFIAALFVAFIGVALVTFGQLPALVLLPVALALGFWGRNKMKRTRGASE